MMLIGLVIGVNEINFGSIWFRAWHTVGAH